MKKAQQNNKQIKRKYIIEETESETDNERVGESGKEEEEYLEIKPKKKTVKTKE